MFDTNFETKQLNTINMKCDFCKKTLVGHIFKINGWKFCISHLDMDQCYHCGFLVSDPSPTKHPLCSRCLSRSIMSKSDGEDHFNSILRWLKMEEISFGNFPLSFKVVDHLELESMTGSTNVLGVCFRERRILEGRSRDEVKVLGVAVLRGMPPEQFAATTVHELAHVWFGLQHVNNQPLWFEEGFSEYWAHRYCLWRGGEYLKQARMIESSTDDIYGGGFHRVKHFVDKYSFKTLLDSLINKTPLKLKLIKNPNS